jgi:hypothetical protein
MGPGIPLETETVPGTFQTFQELWDESCETRPIKLKQTLMDTLKMMPEVLIDLIGTFVPKRIQYKK